MNFEYVFKDRGIIGPRLEIVPNENITGYIYNIFGWLDCDVQGSGEEYIPEIEKVLRGELKERIFSGNAYEAIIHKDYTTISYDFEYCNPTMVPCTLPTQMLYEILQIWVAKQKELREETTEKESKENK